MTCRLGRVSGIRGSVELLQHLCWAQEREIRLICYSISIWSCCNAWNYTKVCDERGRVNSDRCFCGSSSFPFLKIQEQEYREEKAGGVTEIWIL